MPSTTIHPRRSSFSIPRTLSIPRKLSLPSLLSRSTPLPPPLPFPPPSPPPIYLPNDCINIILSYLPHSTLPHATIDTQWSECTTPLLAKLQATLPKRSISKVLILGVSGQGKSALYRQM